MTRILSKQRTAIAYDGGHVARQLGTKRKVTLQPGVNDLTDADAKLLRDDEKFQKHKAMGFYADMDEPPRDADGLRTDGPTLREYQAAGYHPDTYPPAGYAAVAEPEAAATEIVMQAPQEAPPPVDPRVRLDDEDDETYKLRLDAWQTARRAPLPKESKAALRARLAAYDVDDAAFFKTADLSEDQRTFVSDFYAMTQEEQDALRPTLSAEEVELLDANKPQEQV